MAPSRILKPLRLSSTLARPPDACGWLHDATGGRPTVDRNNVGAEGLAAATAALVNWCP